MMRASRNLALLAALFLAACDSAKKETADQGPQLEKRVQAVEEAMKKARDLGADKFAADDFAFQEKKLEDAKALIEDGKTDKVGSKLSSAERAFKDLIQKGEEAAKARAGALEVKKKADQAIAAAKREKIDLLAKDTFDEAQKSYETAKGDLEGSGSSPQRIANSQKAFQHVIDMLQRARGEAKDKKGWMDKATDQKKAALAKEGEAKGAKADQMAADDFTHAQQKAREGEIEYKNGNFREAYDAFLTAENTYLESINRAKEAAELAQANRPDTPPAPPADEKKPEPANPAPEVASGDEGQPTPKAAPEVVPPGELSVEDEAFLQDNVAKLCKNQTPTYEPASGEFSVEYDFAEEIIKDVMYPRGMVEGHIAWRDPMFNMRKDKAEGKKDLGLVFSGNTGGMFLLPFPFKEKVTVEYLVELGVMKSDGALSVILMSSEDGKNYYAADFGTVELCRGGNIKPVRGGVPSDPKQQKSPNLWFKKAEIGGVAMKIEYQPAPDGKRSQINIWYDTEAVTMEKPITIAVVPPRTGLMGFFWYATKFNIRQLKISGKLDKQAAVKMLRARLGKQAASGSGTTAPGGGPPASPAGGAKNAAAPPGSPAGGSKGAKVGDKKTPNKDDDPDY